MNTQSIIVECSREKSVDVRTYGVNDERSGTNAVWTNEVDLDVEPGDKVVIQLGAIHSVGTDTQNVMEITGLEDRDTGMTDNQVLFQFIPYIINNGYNMVVAPYIGLQTQWYLGTWNGTKGSSVTQQDWIIQKCLLQGYPNKPGDNAMNTGEPIYDTSVNGSDGDDVGYNFFFEAGDRNYPWGPKAMKSGHWMPPDGSKFVKINRFYKGPFLTKDSSANVQNDGLNAVFSTVDEDDFRPEYFEVSVQIDAPKYETPATICNFINLALHRTDDPADASYVLPEAIRQDEDAWGNNGAVGSQQEIHTFTGPLMKSFSANGQPATNSYDERSKTFKDENRFWSQICVRDLNKWYGVHYGMRCEIAFNKMPKGTVNGTPNFHCSYPVYYSGKNQMFYTDFEGANAVGETEAFPFRKFTKDGVDYYLFTGIKDMIIPTNIAYTQENINRFKNYIFGKNEKYEGNEKTLEDSQNDIPKWYVDLDIHRTADACNTSDNQIPADQNQNAWSPQPATIATWADFNGNFMDPAYIKYNADVFGLAPAKTGFMANYAWKPGMRATNLALNEGDTGMVRNTLRVYSKYDPNWRNNTKLGNYPNWETTAPAHQGDYKFSGVKDLNSTGQYATDDTMAKEAGVACYPVWVQNSQDDTYYQVIAFALQTDHMTRLANNTWRFQNGARATWAFCSGHWALFSPSSMDNPYGLLYNTQLSVDSNNATKNTTESDLQLPFNGPADSNRVKKEYINNVMLGCQDPQFVFDDTLSRVELKQLHTARRVGVQEVIYSATGQVIGSDIGEQVAKFNDKSMPLGRWNKFRELNHSIVGGDTSVCYPEDRMAPAINTSKMTASPGFSDAVSGVYLNAVYLQGAGDLIQSSLDSNAKLMTEQNMPNSLLYKLGFRYKDLFPDFGDITARHKPQYLNSKQTEYRYKSCKPLTTNADLSIADTTFTDIQDDWYIAPLSTTNNSNKITGSGRGQPNFQLGLPGFEQFMLGTTDSTAIRASKLPTKLDSSIYLVYSDIAMPEYQQSNQKMNIVGIIPRNYSAGDYVYSFGDNSFGNIPIKQKRKLTTIRTEIRTPNGDLAPINEKSTIVYKIIKPYQQPQASLIVNPEPNVDEQLLYQMKKQNKKLEDILSVVLELFDKKIKSVKDKDEPK